MLLPYDVNAAYELQIVSYTACQSTMFIRLPRRENTPRRQTALCVFVLDCVFFSSHVMYLHRCTAPSLSYVRSMVKQQAFHLLGHDGSCFGLIEIIIQHFIPLSTRFEIAYWCTRYERLLRLVLHRENGLHLSMSIKKKNGYEINHLDTRDAGLCTETLRQCNTVPSYIERGARSMFDLREPSLGNQDGYRCIQV